MYWMTSDMKSLSMSGAAALVGMAQVLYTQNNALPIIGGILPASLMGLPQRVYVNAGVGAAAMALAYVGKTKGKFITNDMYQNMLFFYGLTTLFGGVWNYFLGGMTPIAPPAGQAFQLYPPGHRYARTYAMGAGRVL